ncbi:MAG TPA: M23 family metallopeptidase [Bacteroidales bacterium]|nr:M23 family metallopeptidase [Bacteroidales bacterium]HNS45888.1 M23 family metallopeptidase [Bacteroidales bacterium]
MAEKKSLKRKKWIQKLRDKYLLVIRNEDTYEVKLSFRLSRLNVFIVLGLMTIILVVLTIFLIAFTPLREYIPGYMNVDLPRQMYALQLKADSIERAFMQQSIYFENLKNIIEGSDTTATYYQVGIGSEGQLDSSADYQNITLSHSPEDSLLRLEFQRQGRYIQDLSSGIVSPDEGELVPDFLFFSPLEGIVTNRFNADIGHFGVDLVANKNEPIKAILDGMVVFAGWTLETGHVIALQHQQNILSVYKHNAVILKKEGNFVKAGDVIAIIGESGELSTGPHLHFELWFNGNPVDPTDYIRF